MRAQCVELCEHGCVFSPHTFFSFPLVFGKPNMHIGWLLKFIYWVFIVSMWMQEARVSVWTHVQKWISDREKLAGKDLRKQEREYGNESAVCVYVCEMDGQRVWYVCEWESERVLAVRWKRQSRVSEEREQRGCWVVLSYVIYRSVVCVPHVSRFQKSVWVQFPPPPADVWAGHTHVFNGTMLSIWQVCSVAVASFMELL